MVTTLRTHLNRFSKLQRMYLYKDAISGFTASLFIAILTTEIVNNFSSDIILIKNYLMNVPMILITIPFLRKVIKKHPIGCYRLKGLLSVIGIGILLVTEIFSLSKVWYLVDAGIMAFVGLLMMNHKAYYKSSVVDKCKDFSEQCGNVELLNNITYVFMGLSIVYFNIPTLVLLSIAFPLEMTERYLENKCVDIVYKD